MPSRHTHRLCLPAVAFVAATAVAALLAAVPAQPAGGAGAAPSFTISDQARRHWAFQPVAPAQPPAVADAGWARSDVDRFVLAKLEQKGLKPARPADKRTLIRRATFDLHGLPPTPEEVDAFVADQSPDAFAKVVDRLLASPRYGERWGRHWLDVVRYADTAGETADIPVREAYKYRDWVIAAFNADQPYDEFVREQIAGDILAAQGPRERYASRVTATGFLAISRRFGFDSENYQHLTIADTIDTTGQAVLGLTLGCARCHDHKYDPVSARDYYALYGVFDSTRYAFPGAEQKQFVRAMMPLVPPAESRPLLEAFHQKVGELEDALFRLQVTPPKVKTVLLDDLDGDFELQAHANGGSLGVLVAPWVTQGVHHVNPPAQSPLRHVYRRMGNQGLGLPPGEAVASAGRAVLPARVAGGVKPVYFNIDFRIANNDTDGKGDGAWRVYLGHGPGISPAVEVFVARGALRVRNGDQIDTVRQVVEGQCYNLQLVLDLDRKTYRGAAGVYGDVTAIPDKAFTPGWDGKLDYIQIDSRGDTSGPRPWLHLDNIALRDEPLPPLPASDPFQPNQPPPATAPEELRRQWSELVEKGPMDVAYAVAEGTPRDAALQKRGDPTTPGEIVPRGFLEILGGDRLTGEQAESGSGRLQLAEWLTRPTNPLTARVMVNRIWQKHFGEGLVRTENDFGLRGRPPTHPELLDWLADRFIKDGWSVKRMHRLIMGSAAYQLSSDHDPRAAEVDPGNELLWHFSRRRLDAESIRDAMLTVSGKLDLSPNPGPHPFPAVEASTFSQHGPFAAAAYDTNRRSVYLMVQRTKRHPYLALFDGADPNATTAERGATTVPTQALFAMNSPFVHDQSTGFAQRLIAAEPADPARRVGLAHRTALGREATDVEVAKAAEFVARYKEQLQAAGVPADQHEPAAWSAYARTLLAGNEFLFVD